MKNTHMVPVGARASLGLLAGALIRVVGFCAVAMLIQAPDVFGFF